MFGLSGLESIVVRERGLADVVETRKEVVWMG